MRLEQAARGNAGRNALRCSGPFHTALRCRGAGRQVLALAKAIGEIRRDQYSADTFPRDPDHSWRSIRDPDHPKRRIPRRSGCGVVLGYDRVGGSGRIRNARAARTKRLHGKLTMMRVDIVQTAGELSIFEAVSGEGSVTGLFGPPRRSKT